MRRTADELADGVLTRTTCSPHAEFQDLKKRRFLPFSDADAYRLLKVATEAFVMVNCGVALTSYPPFDREDLELLISRTGVDGLGMDRFERLWKGYLERVNGTKTDHAALPGAHRQQVSGRPHQEPDLRCDSRCAISPSRAMGSWDKNSASRACVELIWSYWHEEAMLVQSMNAISLRFQNRRARNGDPLANMELSPLRPLNNLLWGYIQDEQHRLTVMRRADEYDHQYGLRLEGRAAPHYRTADSRVAVP